MKQTPPKDFNFDKCMFVLREVNLLNWSQLFQVIICLFTHRKYLGLPEKKTKMDK
jgi:hypothetical protein